MESAVDLAPDVLVGGRYRLIDPVARGGTASVWRAMDERLQRHVALKVLREDDDIDPQLRSRAEREAVVLASLEHRNLVKVYDSGVDDGRPFLVMELLQGRSLHRILQDRGRLEAEEAVRLVAEIAEGLGVAHRAGVIHRDVKPANIMCNDDVPTLVDFGIARRTDATTMTRGLVLGTASYLAPEQAQGLPLTPAADVYALGCVLHELLTGAPPFAGDGPLAVAFKHVHDEAAAPSSIVDGVPPAVDAVVLRCLSKEPTARPADGAALATELHRALSADADATVAAAPLGVVAPGPATMVMPAPVTTAAPAAPASTAPSMPSPSVFAADAARWRIVAALVIAAIVLLVALRALAGGGDDTVVVPEIIGDDRDTALSELDDAGLEAEVIDVDSDQPAGTVVMAGPGPGLEAPSGSTVQVAVSNGSQVPVVDATVDLDVGGPADEGPAERGGPPGRDKPKKPKG